jgi:hypothetical protein
VGTWTFQSACGLQTMSMAMCPGQLDITLNASGTFTFNADGTFSEVVTADESGTETIPAACLAGTTDCTKLNNTTTIGGLTMTTSNCSGSASTGCTCTVTETGTFTQTGTYTTAGTNVSQTTGGTPSGPGSAYCVSGNALLLSVNAADTQYLIFTK